MRKYQNHIQHIIDRHQGDLLASLQEERLELDLDQALGVFLQADPTPNKRLVDWMVKAYINQGFLWEDVEMGAESKVAELLGDYIACFSCLPKDQRDIYQYMSYGKLYKLVAPYLAVASDLDISDTISNREKKKREREEVLAESQVLYRSNRAIIAVPLTERASCWWGRGTKWCTSARGKNYFNSYNKNAPLIVINITGENVLNSDQQEKSFFEPRKLQIWTFTDSSGKQPKSLSCFMDESDEEVDHETVKKYYDILQPILEQTVKQDGMAIKFIPEEYRTAELCRIAVEQNVTAFFSVPNKHKTFELCKQAVSLHGILLKDIPEISITRELCTIAVNQTGAALYFVPKQFLTDDLCRLAIQNYPESFQYVPKEKITQEFCNFAFANDFNAIRFIPLHFISDEMSKQAVKNKGFLLKYVPNSFKTVELCRQAIEQDVRALDFILDKMKTPEVYTSCIKRDGMAIVFIPVKERTVEMCTWAVESNSRSFVHVPEQLQNDYICKLAIESTGTIIANFRESLITAEICWLAIEKTLNAFYYVPERFKTPEMCWSVVSKVPKLICYVPEQLKSGELCKLAYEQDHNSIQYIPESIREEFKMVETVVSAKWDMEVIQNLSKIITEKLDGKDKITGLTNILV